MADMLRVTELALCIMCVHAVRALANAHACLQLQCACMYVYMYVWM